MITCKHVHTDPHGHLIRQWVQGCLELGETWVHLRLCLTCGHVGCCNNSKNRHATKQLHATDHPTIQSFEPSENWRWC